MNGSDGSLLVEMLPDRFADFFMEKRKYFAVASIICLLVLFQSLATLRLALSVAYPERILREVIADYFMKSLEKAVKFEDVAFDHHGNIVITGLDISITSDFNDNISLVKCRKGIVDLVFLQLMAGRVRVRGIDIYAPQITLIKRYGKSYSESLQQAIDTKKFLAHIREGGGRFTIRVSDAAFEYRESLSDRLVTVRFDDIDGRLSIDEQSLSYRINGDIRRHRSEIIRRGDFSCRGSIDLTNLDSFRHGISVNNFDLSYLNEHIMENKWASVSLEGGGSIGLEITGAKGPVLLKGTVETNTLTVSSLEKQFDYVANENLNLDFDMTIHEVDNSFTVRKFRLHDGVFSIEALGGYARDDKDHRLDLKFKTNRINLSDLSQTITPCRGYIYSGYLECDGGMKLDFKKGDAREMAFNAVLDDFTVTKHEKGDPVLVMERSSARINLGGDALHVSIESQPLGSDLSIKSATKISGWMPLKSETELSVHSRRMNLRALTVSLAALGDAVYGSAYEDRSGPLERPPFSGSLTGKFMNYNTVNIRSKFDSVFYGKKARWNNCVAELNLNRGTLLLTKFELEGYGARYDLSLQGYFNSEMPYFKMEGRIDEFNVTDFYADSGMKGNMTGTGRADFSYDVSVARPVDILNNSKGRYAITIAAGELKNTNFQLRLADFLKKNGYTAVDLNEINFESVTLAGTHQGEHFWISALGIRGDDILSNCFGEYQYTRGLTCNCSASLRSETSGFTVPLKLKGPLSSPCLVISGKEKGGELCF